MALGKTPMHMSPVAPKRIDFESVITLVADRGNIVVRKVKK